MKLERTSICEDETDCVNITIGYKTKTGEPAIDVFKPSGAEISVDAHTLTIGDVVSVYEQPDGA